jgi:hypothetical protein
MPAQCVYVFRMRSTVIGVMSLNNANQSVLVTEMLCVFSWGVN